MYHYTTPPLGIAVNLPSALASAKGPVAAALSLSSSDRMTANQLQSHINQARKAREKLIDQVTKPPEPGWKTAVYRISDTVNRMEQVLSVLQSQASLPAKLVQDTDALAVYPSGAAMQQSGRTSDMPPSAAESPTALSGSTPKDTPSGLAAEATRASSPRVVYVMDDGVMILGRPPERRRQTAEPPQPSPTQPNVTSPGASRSGETSAQTMEGRTTSSSIIVNLQLAEAQKPPRQDLIALTRKGYAQVQGNAPGSSADLISSTKIGITGALDQAPAFQQSPDRITLTEGGQAPRGEAAVRPDSVERPAPEDPLHASAEPFARNATEDARESAQRQVIALQMDGHNDIIYIVPPAKAAMDLIA